ncbi:MAG: MmgE/PrpD family protein [Streptosporangiales bacterium]|nr:MmgE/PrpD family protein [Streptosporangiales bacterium]
MSDTESVAVTRSLAEYASSADLCDMPEDVAEIARRSLVDTVGVTIAARGDDAVGILRTTLGGELPPGDATVLTDGTLTNARTAALVNATAGHALDYDDVTDLTYGHPSVVLWPALLAAAETGRRTGRELLEAFVIGFQVQCAVASGMAVRTHYGRGWHSTATIGVLGAAAGVARLHGLDVDQTRCALGLAASMAGGSRQNFGTMTKPLHPGLAARDAVFAADLAGNGFTADPDQLESALGYFAMFGDSNDLTAVEKTLQTPWALTAEGLSVKKYACCYCTHRTADATIDLVHEDGVDAGEVRSVQLTLEPAGFDPLIHHRPTTGLQGKFSAEYVIAAALLDKRVTLATFTDDAVQRPEAQQLLRKVEVDEQERPPVGPAQWEQAYAVVQVDTARGPVTKRVDVPRGDRRAPLDRDGIEVKFRDCVEFSGSGIDADALLTQLWNFDTSTAFRGFDAVRSAGTAA